MALTLAAVPCVCSYSAQMVVGLLLSIESLLEEPSKAHLLLQKPKTTARRTKAAQCIKSKAFDLLQSKTEMQAFGTVLDKGLFRAKRLELLHIVRKLVRCHYLGSQAIGRKLIIKTLTSASQRADFPMKSSPRETFASIQSFQIQSA